MRVLRHIALYVFATALFYAGATHFMYDHGYARMLPSWVPFKLIIIYVTGITEWLLSLLLVFPQTRRAAGFATASFLFVVWPANFYAAIYGIPAPWSEETTQIVLWIRILFQPLLMWWVIIASKDSKQ
ncbi:Uncharacterized membrane protein [Halobacillus karajensis]|uniref:Membrane protein n=1 Tax=Halobacillus karajensis TaxID=195088 RepID=A0A024P8Q9_9BACI|nr:hypothetical protein [Halobacillus karajensis]CDQ21584.1 putative membrane protein [Halobacillus karajensis]CDQ25519.1 putative membrane protein [Halobacillus karajensis]CDQ28951.1 putative membrane protein [Halobacillus karajensis]SEI08742.1 Uncharacterized membrane protein [Halobacillus karajensis]